MSFENPHAIIGLFGAFLYASGGLLITLGLRMRSIRERRAVLEAELAGVGR